MQAILDGLPLYSEYVPGAAAAQLGQSLGLWTRPATSWSLECETSHPKQETIAALQQ